MASDLSLIIATIISRVSSRISRLAVVSMTATASSSRNAPNHYAHSPGRQFGLRFGQAYSLINCSDARYAESSTCLCIGSDGCAGWMSWPCGRLWRSGSHCPAAGGRANDLSDVITSRGFVYDFDYYIAKRQPDQIPLNQNNHILVHGRKCCADDSANQCSFIGSNRRPGNGRRGSLFDNAGPCDISGGRCWLEPGSAGHSDDGQDQKPRHGPGQGTEHQTDWCVGTRCKSRR